MTMKFLWRIVQIPIVLWVVYTLSFFLCEADPADPLYGTAEKLPPEPVMQARRALYGYDAPMLVRYVDWLGQYVRGDLGLSASYGDRRVTEVLRHSLPKSLILGGYALGIAIVLGMTAGVIGAVYRDRVIDYATLAVALVGISVPSFVVAATLLVVFALYLGWFPVGGWGPYAWGHIAYLTLPAVALSLPAMAYIARLTRNGMLEVLEQDFVRTARAKGAGSLRVMLKHCLRHAAMPVVSFLGPAAASVLTGSFVIEKVFHLPGMGDHFVKAVLDRDRRLILSVVMIYATLLVVFNALVDAAYTILDPRTRDSS